MCGVLACFRIAACLCASSGRVSLQRPLTRHLTSSDIGVSVLACRFRTLVLGVTLHVSRMAQSAAGDKEPSCAPPTSFSLIRAAEASHPLTSCSRRLTVFAARTSSGADPSAKAAGAGVPFCNAVSKGRAASGTSVCAHATLSGPHSAPAGAGVPFCNAVSKGPPSAGDGAEEQHVGGMAQSAAGDEKSSFAPASSFGSIRAAKASHPLPSSSRRQTVFAGGACGCCSLDCNAC